MALIKIPFNTPPNQNTDSILLNAESETLYDGYIVTYVDQEGLERFATVKRPGLAYAFQIGTLSPSQGQYWWKNKKVLISVSDGSIHKVTDSTGTRVDLTNDALLETGRPTFATNGTHLVMANGGKIIYTDGTTTTAYITDGDAPTLVTHVAFYDQWLLAFQVGTATVHFCDFVSAPTAWNALDVFTAEESPDYLVAMYVHEGKIVFLGESSVEIWFNDGVTPFSKLQGASQSVGTMSPHGNAIVQKSIYFFDDKRTLKRLTQNTVEPVNNSFNIAIQKFDTVSDCIADYVTFEGRNWLLFTFPTEQRTLFFNLDLNHWAEWSYWDTQTATRNRFLGASYAYATDWNKHFFGSFLTDDFLYMDSLEYLDCDNKINFLKQTGNIDHGNHRNYKFSHVLDFKLKTGVGMGAGGNDIPYATLRYRSDGNSSWSNYRNLPLGVLGDREFLVSTDLLGAYKTRQYEFSFIQNAPCIIGEVIEDVTIGGKKNGV